MNSSFRLALFCVCVVAMPALAQSTPGPEDVKKKASADAYRRMSDSIATAQYQHKMPFATFLDKVNKQLSSESRFTIRLDRDAFGKDADKILKKEISFPPVPAKMNMSLALRLALAQAAGDKYQIEFSAGPGEIVITTRDRSLYTMTYDIREHLPHTRLLHEYVKQFRGGVFGEDLPGDPIYDLQADPAKPVEWIVRQIMAPTNRAGWKGRTPASNVRIIDGTKLIIHTAPSVHEEIDQFLATMRHLADLAVVMNARLFELDRAEYDDHFAAAFIDPKEKSARKLVATVTDSQWKRLQAMKPIVGGGDAKLVPSERGEFLSVRNAYQYQAKPGDKAPTTAFEGMSFTVRPILSPDRRCLRLEISHDVAQLVKITKGTMVDLKTGKDAPIELPNIRKSSATGTIEIHDGQPILLAVDYRLRDKVWLVVAQPRIYMEEEETQIRKGAFKRMPLAGEKPAPMEIPFEEPQPKPPVELPNNNDVKQILDAIVTNVLTDPKHKEWHAHYGTPGDAKFTLIQGAEFVWPKGYQPNVAGFALQKLDPDECRSFRKKLLGIRIDVFEWTPKKGEPTGAKVMVVIDDAIHGALGAMHIIYEAKREGKKWHVSWSEAFTH